MMFGSSSSGLYARVTQLLKLWAFSMFWQYKYYFSISSASLFVCLKFFIRHNETAFLKQN